MKKRYSICTLGIVCVLLISLCIPVFAENEVYSEWSQWQSEPISASGTIEVETRVIDTTAEKIQYHYEYWRYPNPSSPDGFNYKGNSNYRGTYYETTLDYRLKPYKSTSDGQSYIGGRGNHIFFPYEAWYNEKEIKTVQVTGSITEYRYRTKSLVVRPSAAHLENGTYQIISQDNEYYFNSFNQQATACPWSVVLAQNDHSDEQKFSLTKQSDGSYKIEVVRKDYANKIVTIDGDISNGTRLVTKNTSNTPNQSFVLVERSEGTFTLSPLSNPELVVTMMTTMKYGSYFLELQEYSDFNKKQLFSLKNASTSPPEVDTIIWPVSNPKITSVFGNGYSTLHPAHDIVSTTNDNNIYAFCAGKVIKVAQDNISGNYVVIEHNQNGKTFYSYYGHLEKQNVSVGNEVNSGQVIGIMGATGLVTGKHLHFQITNKPGPQSINLVTPTKYDENTEYVDATDRQKNVIRYYNPQIILNNKSLDIIR